MLPSILLLGSWTLIFFSVLSTYCFLFPAFCSSYSLITHIFLFDVYLHTLRLILSWLVTGFLLLFRSLFLADNARRTVPWWPTDLNGGGISNQSKVDLVLTSYRHRNVRNSIRNGYDVSSDTDMGLVTAIDSNACINGICSIILCVYTSLSLIRFSYLGTFDVAVRRSPSTAKSAGFPHLWGWQRRVPFEWLAESGGL